MALALSGGTLVYTEFNAPGRTQFVDNIMPIFDRAGWPVASTVTGGFELRMRSPQSTGGADKTALLRIANNGVGSYLGSPLASVQIVSDLDPSVHSVERHLKVGAGIKYRCLIGPSQFHIWRPGVLEDTEGAMCCGGVPWVPAETVCQGIVPGVPVNEIWWMASDETGTFFPASHPRKCLMASGPTHGGDAPNRADGCWNGLYHGMSSPGQWQILPVKGLSPWKFAYDFGLPLSPHLWMDGTGFIYEPLMSWGTTNTSPGRIRAQAWDSRVNSKQATMDTVDTDDDGTRWLNFTDGYYWGSWQLLIPNLTVGGETNEAYGT